MENQCDSAGARPLRCLIRPQRHGRVRQFHESVLPQLSNVHRDRVNDRRVHGRGRGKDR